jgi:predicted glycoside hydrolase/deacetylase ChbG (UPF0249 family)
MAVAIGWHADAIDARIASIRYRLLQPMAALQAGGTSVALFDDQQPLGDYSAIVFSKSYGPHAIDIARAARGLNVGVIFDLCDNIFAAHQAGKASEQRVARLREMLALATHLTFSTAELAKQILALRYHRTDRSTVIADVIAKSAEPTDAITRRGERDLTALDRFLRRNPGALHCIWFGKSLGALSGYVHVDRAVRELEAFARVRPVTLTIQSDERLRYLLARRRWHVPTHYVPWRLDTADAALARHRVALIPVERNAYTIGKTINRPATALLNGLDVVADPIPAYEELRSFIELDDWQRGLRDAGAHEADASSGVARGRAYLEANYGAVAIAGQWRRMLETEIALLPA